MSEYEITYLTDSALGEEARTGVDSSVDAHIDELTGKINHASPSIPRRLFYPVKKKVNAGLRALHIELDPAKLADLREYLKKHTDILRFTILNTPKREEVSADIVAKYGRGKAGLSKKVERKPISKVQKPAKPVTMEAVEKGIEEALSEEVK